MGKIDKKEIHYYFSMYISNRNEKNLENLYVKYKSLVYKIAFSFLKNESDAEDIVQNIFLKINCVDFNQLPKDYEASWLYTITKNECINSLKSKKESISINEIYTISSNNDLINKVIEMEDFNNLIKKLPEKDKEIISLKILSDLSFKKISELLNIPIGTVEWRYYKSLGSIKLIINSFIIFVVTLCTGIIRNNQQKKKFNEKLNISQIGKNTLDKNENNVSENNFIDGLVDRRPLNENTNTTIEEITLNTNTFKSDIVTNGLFVISLIFFAIMCISIIFAVKHRFKRKNNYE